MSVLLGSARVDERGQYSGGNAGDQTGKEVSTQSFYLHKRGWYCLRPTNSMTANVIANAMASACLNNNIGYDQGERTSVIKMLKKYGSLAKIAEKCDSDCSSLVRACCIEAGFDPGNFTTANEVQALVATGKFTPAFEITKESEVRTGDILVTKTKGHTVVVVMGSVNNTTPTPVKVVEKVNKPIAAKSKDAGIAGTYVVTASSLNIRYGPGVNYDSMAKLIRGTKCTCYGYFTEVSGVKWFLVVSGNYTGYVSSEYLDKQ